MSWLGSAGKPRRVNRYFLLPLSKSQMANQGVKKRWYQVKDGVFSWYHLEERQKVIAHFLLFVDPLSLSLSQDINCDPNGSQKMASVVEIMGYSTSPDLQRMFKYCFVFQCSDGQRYQFGVSSFSFPFSYLCPIGSGSDHQTTVDCCTSDFHVTCITRTHSIHVRSL